MSVKIGDAAEIIDVTTATIRNYGNEFSEFLSSDATRQHRKRYNPQDIATLKEIKRLRDDGFTYKEIPEYLETIPEVIDAGQDETHAYDDVGQDNAIAPLEFFTNMLEVQQDQHKREISAKDETISILKDDIEILRQELTQERRSWWRKLFNS